LTLRILHSTHAWLKTTENWVARLVGNVPDAENGILTREYLPTAPLNFHFHRHHWPLANLDLAQGDSWFLAWRIFRNLSRPLEERLVASSLWGKYDLVHSHFSFVGWETMPVAKRLGIPHVVSFYGYDYEYLPYIEPVWVGRYRRMFREVDRFLCEGQHGCEILERMGCPSSKIGIAKLGVSPGGIRFYPDGPGRGNGFKIVQIASLTAKKGHEDAIRAVARASRVVPDIFFAMIGGEGDVIAEDLLALAATLGVGDRVEWIPGIDFSKLHEVLARYHLFLHPSKYTSDHNCEGGAPIVLLDAQAVGLPVVSTEHCDIPCEVLHGETGFLSPEGDIKDIASNIVKVANLPEAEYRKMRAAGRRHVQEHYDVADNGILLRKIYADLRSSHRKGFAG
jgi:colanic acid/amylovoran biosynthesis glycosyltransferase